MKQKMEKTPQLFLKNYEIQHTLTKTTHLTKQNPDYTGNQHKDKTYKRSQIKPHTEMQTNLPYNPNKTKQKKKNQSHAE